MVVLQGTPESCWTSTALWESLPGFTGKAECDVVIVGAGIVGLTTALELCEAGKSVIVLEARRVGYQVTGRSTAKITTQHSLIYQHLLDTFGFDTALAYANANREAIERIQHWIATLDIACDYECKSAYAYACAPGWNGAIEREAAAALRLGFDARVLDQAPLPFSTATALEFPDQAQFNPASYLLGLSDRVQALGGRIYEQSRAISFDRSRGWEVGTDLGTVTAPHVVIATNMTVKSPKGYANRTQPRCHVAMAFRTDQPAAINGMFIGLDEPTHSLRVGRDQHGPLIIALGPRFNTGQDGDIAQRFIELDRWAHAHLPVGETAWRWCNEDYDTADRMPFVGQPDAAKAPGFYVATGFNAWGISNGTAAGRMIVEEIVRGSHSWGKLYDPSRSAPDGFHQSGDTQSAIDDTASLSPGEGGVVTHGDERIAVWRDEDGALHALSASCTHKGCTVTWNNADKTWDCPCHGSIFESNGAVIHGPARSPLKPAQLPTAALE